jgi:hypothetical protein
MLQNLSRVLFFLGMGVVASSGLEAAAPRPQGPNPQQIQQAQQQAMQQLQRAIQQQQQQAQRMQQQMMQQARVAGQQMTRQMQQLARQNRNAPRPGFQEVQTDYDFVFLDAGLVRTMVPLTLELDDKGRPKQLDPEEKKKTKGDTPEERRLAGYKAALEDLQPGDEITVTLSRHRPLRKSKSADDGGEEKPKKKDSEKDKEKDADKDKAKEKDADKDKADKDKDKDKDKAEKTKEKEMEDEEAAVRRATRAEWRPFGKLQGVVSDVDPSGSRRITIRVVTEQVVMRQPNQGNNNNNNNPPAVAQKSVSIDPSQLQGTFLVILKRGKGDGAGGFGSKSN